MVEQPTEQTKTTIVSFLLDRSGWMVLIKEETIAGFNAFLDALEREPGDRVDFTLQQFDDQEVETVCLGTMLAAVPRLTAQTYRPHSGPALIDPCLAVIKATEEMTIGRTDKPRVLVVLHAGDEDDGWIDPRIEGLRSLIDRRRAEGWLFMLVASEIDGYSTARSLGIDDDATITFSGLPGAVHAMTAAAEIAGALAQGRADRVCFTAEQKRGAGDPWFDIVISDEAIERAMRVYSVEDCMEHLNITQPSALAPTEECRAFLADLQARLPTPAVQRAVGRCRTRTGRRAAGDQPEHRAEASPVAVPELSRLRRMSDPTAPLKLPPVCPCAALRRPPDWAKGKIEDGEIVCCRAAMHYSVERGDDQPLCRSAGDEVYRITYQQAFGEHAWVRIGRRGDEVSIYRVHHPETFSDPERFEAVLPLVEWQLLQDALAAANFWSLPAYVPPQGTYLDGCDVIVEGRRGHLFKTTRLNNPDVDELWQLGRVAFDLADLSHIRL